MTNNKRNLRGLYTQFLLVIVDNQTSKYILKDYTLTEALKCPVSPDQVKGDKVLPELENSISLQYVTNDSLNASYSIYKYFVLQTLVIKALDSETVYTLTLNSLLPLLLELQKGDTLAVDKSKVREK